MKKKLTIVISGLPGAGSSTLSKKIARALGYEYFSPGEYYKRLFGKLTSESALKGWKTDLGKSEDLHKKIDEIQIEKAKKGGVVICGKLSLYFLRKIADFKVWLDASLEVRAKRTAKRDKISFEKALEILKEREKIESQEFKKIYGLDYYKLKDYADFILDNNNLKVEEAAKIILKKIEETLNKSK